jgi:autotransporter-associated beta strand protein
VTLIPPGANTYTGDTTITHAGSKDPGLFLHNPLALQNSTLNYNVTGSDTILLWFEAGQTNYTDGYTLGGLKGGKNLNLSPQGNTAKNLRIGNNNQDTTYDGVISSSNDVLAGITKIGSGILTLTKTCTYPGPTTVTSGTLKLGALGGFSNSSGVTIKPGAILDTSAITTYTIPASPKTYTLQIDGTGAGSCGKIKAAGLGIASATVIFTEVTTPDDPVYVIAEYTGLTGATFFTATPPAGYSIDYAYAGGTRIALVSLTPTPYADWALAKGLTGLPGSATDPAPGADPDNDGRTNSQEFALDGDPLSGTNDGKVVAKVATLPSDSSRVLTLSLPVRTGAVFSGPGDLVSTAIDGLTYSIQGSDDLGDFTSMTITEIIGDDATSVQTGLPALSSSAWSYRTFRSPGTVNDGDPRDFLRVKVEQP